jgi:hypothetical protein
MVFICEVAKQINMAASGRKNRSFTLVHNIVGLPSVVAPTEGRAGGIRRFRGLMRMMNGTLVSVAAGLALALAALPSVSRAAIVETIVEPSTDATLGSITFPTFTGDSDAGVLFSFDGFTQADTTSISWTVAPITDEVIALDLNALQGDADCPSLGTNCSNSTLNLTETVATEGSNSCSSGAGISSCMGLERLHPVAFRALGAVPELSTWAMMLLGFAGLGLAGYRRARGSHRLAA